MVSKLLLAAVLMTSMAQAAPKANVRVIETSHDLAQMFLEEFPGQLKPVTSSVLLVPEKLVNNISALTHEKTGHCGGFMDITNEGPRKRFIQSPTDLPPLSGKKDWISSMLADVRPTNIKDFVNLYSGRFTTRNAKSAEGKAAPQWLRDTWQKMADDAGRTDIKVELLPPPKGYQQNSVRITIPGSDRDASVVVMGGHLDSINQNFGSKAPGADDDASGISALTEAYRVMLANKVRPKHAIQIFGYAAEEQGLLGSRAIAEHYREKNIAVRGVLQLDMVAYPGDTRAVTFMTDNVDKSLTQWTQQLYGTYVGLAYKESRCGYGCSDHASWHRYGYPAVMPFETTMEDMNRRIHTTKDLWDELLDADYAANFTKLALAFAAELSSN